MKAERMVRWWALPALLLAGAGCTSAGLQRAGHDLLQQHACERSEARGSCQRSWQNEYDAWQIQLADFRATLDEQQASEANKDFGWHQLPPSLVAGQR